MDTWSQKKISADIFVHLLSVVVWKMWSIPYNPHFNIMHNMLYSTELKQVIVYKSTLENNMNENPFLNYAV